MIAAIICTILALICLTQGAVQGAIALGIAAAILYFMFGSNFASKAGSNKAPQPKSNPKKTNLPDAKYRATPSLVVHYRSNPVVAQIIRDLLETGAMQSISFSKYGDELTANGGSFYRYVFKDHGYQPLTLQEQEAFLLAIVEQLPYSQTYCISYTHVENSTVPICYTASTSFYRTNHYRWNPDTRAWEQMTKL